VGSIPLAAVLWNGGISFGGVVAFILADLIVLPILDIYRQYYEIKMSLFILATFHVSMSLAALANRIRISGARRGADTSSASSRGFAAAQLHHDPDVLLLGLASLLVWRFFT
jgi:uncharacterized protein